MSPVGFLRYVESRFLLLGLVAIAVEVTTYFQLFTEVKLYSDSVEKVVTDSAPLHSISPPPPFMVFLNFLMHTDRQAEAKMCLQNFAKMTSFAVWKVKRYQMWFVWFSTV